MMDERIAARREQVIIRQRLKGLRAEEGMRETDADPQNPNVVPLLVPPGWHEADPVEAAGPRLSGVVGVGRIKIIETSTAIIVTDKGEAPEETR